MIVAKSRETKIVVDGEIYYWGVSHIPGDDYPTLAVVSSSKTLCFHYPLDEWSHERFLTSLKEAHTTHTAKRSLHFSPGSRSAPWGNKPHSADTAKRSLHHSPVALSLRKRKNLRATTHLPNSAEAAGLLDAATGARDQGM